MSIKQLRESVGMSKEDFCERFHVNSEMLYTWESGNRKCPPYAEKLIQRFITAEKCPVFVYGLPFSRILDISGMSTTEFSKFYDIPRRTVCNWKGGIRNPKEYVLLLLERAVKEDKLSGLL